MTIVHLGLKVNGQNAVGGTSSEGISSCTYTQCVVALVVIRPMQQAEQRRIKEEQIAAEQQAHEAELLTDHKSTA